MAPKWGGLHDDDARARSTASRNFDSVDDDATSSSSHSNSQRSARSASLRVPLRVRLLKRPRLSQRPSVPVVSPSSLFNRLQTASLTVIDCRGAADFAAGHIRGSLHCENGRRCRQKTVDEVLQAHTDSACAMKLATRDMMEIVVVGSNRSSNSLLYRMDSGYRFAKLLLKEGRVFSVVFLAVGLQAFVTAYPFMLQRSIPTGVTCSISTEFLASPRPSVKSIEDDDVVEEDAATCSTPSKSLASSASSPATAVLQYPNEIVDGFLFLGNFWQANNAQVIADLGITHVVNMGAITDDRSKFEQVTYLDVEIKDRETVDIRKEFEHTVAFIQAASRERGARVLIHCVQGVSRSSTIVIWYLMLETKCTLSAAYSYVLERRPLIFPNRGFMEQLMENEKKLYGFESVLPQELDLLQHGLLAPLDRKGSALRLSQSS